MRLGIAPTAVEAQDAAHAPLADAWVAMSPGAANHLPAEWTRFELQKVDDEAWADRAHLEFDRFLEALRACNVGSATEIIVGHHMLTLSYLFFRLELQMPHATHWIVPSPEGWISVDGRPAAARAVASYLLKAGAALKVKTSDEPSYPAAFRALRSLIATILAARKSSWHARVGAGAGRGLALRPNWGNRSMLRMALSALKAAVMNTAEVSLPLIRRNTNRRRDFDRSVRQAVSVVEDNDLRQLLGEAATTLVHNAECVDALASDAEENLNTFAPLPITIREGTALSDLVVAEAARRLQLPVCLAVPGFIENAESAQRRAIDLWMWRRLAAPLVDRVVAVGPTQIASSPRGSAGRSSVPLVLAVLRYNRQPYQLPSLSVDLTYAYQCAQALADWSLPDVAHVHAWVPDSSELDAGLINSIVGLRSSFKVHTGGSPPADDLAEADLIVGCDQHAAELAIGAGKKCVLVGPSGCALEHMVAGRNAIATSNLSFATLDRLAREIELSLETEISPPLDEPYIYTLSQRIADPLSGRSTCETA